jgi:hypothetical protein
MASPHNKQQLKAERIFNEHPSAGGSQRHAKMKTERGLSASAERPVFGDAIARRSRGRLWSESKAPSE